MNTANLMCGKTFLDRVPSAALRAKIEVEDIEKHLAEHRLRWLGHIERMDEANVIRSGIRKFSEISRGRPKKTWGEVVKEDISRRGLSIEDAQIREEWRCCYKELVDPD